MVFSRSQAHSEMRIYPHGAKYLRQLEMLAKVANIASERPDTMPDHADFATALRKTHARKSDFWRLLLIFTRDFAQLALTVTKSTEKTGAASTFERPGSRDWVNRQWAKGHVRQERR